MVAILQHIALVKYQIFGTALETAERLLQCMCCGERERKRAKPGGFRGCDTGCERLSFSLHLSSWDVFQSTRRLNRGSLCCEAAEKPSQLGFLLGKTANVSTKELVQLLELLAQSPNSVSAQPKQYLGYCTGGAAARLGCGSRAAMALTSE